MKKLSAISALMGLAFIGTAGAANVTLYYSPTCPHCHHAREFIEGRLVYEYPQIAVTQVNVMTEQNRDAFMAALDKCKYESGGVPVIVVGDKCFQGYADFMQDELRHAVEADMSTTEISAAAENKSAMDKDADAFRNAHPERAGVVTEQSSENVKKKDSGASDAWFYGLLIVLVGALGFVLLRGNGKKK